MLPCVSALRHVISTAVADPTCIEVFLLSEQKSFILTMGYSPTQLHSSSPHPLPILSTLKDSLRHPSFKEDICPLVFSELVKL